MNLIKNFRNQFTSVLTRDELKQVIGGNIEPGEPGRRCKDRHTVCGEGKYQGTCEQNSNEKCVCNTGTQSWIAEECVA